MPSTKPQTILRIDPKLKEELKKVCEKEGTNLNAKIEELIREYLNKK